METGTRASVPLTLYTYAEFLGLAVGFLPIMTASAIRHRNDPTQRKPGRWMRRFGRTSSYLSPVWDFSWEGTPPEDIEVIHGDTDNTPFGLGTYGSRSTPVSG